MWKEEHTHIGTLHVRGAERNDPALRLAIANQLGGADLKPSGMPPSAVLVVRRLADPLPGGFTVQPGSGRPDPDWERAVQRQLEASFSNAAQPDRGRLPGNAEAIVFTDEAELLACLVSDIASGEAWQRWWWKAILKRIPLSFGPSACIRELLCEKAVYLPVVAGRLAEWNRAEAVFKNIEPRDSMTLLQALLAVHGFTELKTAVIEAAGMAPDDSLVRNSDISSYDRPDAGDHPIDSAISPAQRAVAGSEKTESPYLDFSESVHLAAFWQRYLPSVRVPEVLRKEQLLLFGLSLSILKVPQLARSREFQNEVIEWWRNPDKYNYARGMRRHSAAPEAPGVKHKARTQRSEAAVKPLQRASTQEDKVDAEQHDTLTLSALKDRKSKRSSRSADAEANAETIREQEQEKIRELERGGLTAEDASELSTIHPETATAVPDIETDEEQPGTSLTGNFVHTRLGGVLYLLNLMSQLNLPGCFEQDWRLGSRLGRWAFLELMARGLVAQGHEDDPLWKVFAELDQRPSKEPPGKYFTGSSSYRLPPAWFDLLRSGEETFHWASSRGSMRLWSSQGYVLTETSGLAGDPQARAEAELRQWFVKDSRSVLCRKAYSKAPLVRPVWLEKAGVSKDLVRWFSLALPFVRQYFYSILKSRDHASPNQTVLKRLLLCPGKLYVTATHVDFATDINNISISARMSGLDRNPGWLPEYGRVVLFHFE